MYIMRKKNNITKRKDLYIMDLNDKQKNFVDNIYKEYGDIKEVTRKQLEDVYKKHKGQFPRWLTSDKDLRISKGVYKMPGDVVKNVETKTEDIKSQAAYLSLIHI